MRPALLKFLKNAESAGFVNAIPDPDGCIRKVNPFLKHDGKYYGQLVFPSLLKKT